MFSQDTTDVLAMEYAITYRKLERIDACIQALAEIRSLAYRTIGEASFEAALEVQPKFSKNSVDAN